MRIFNVFGRLGLEPNVQQARCFCGNEFGSWIKNPSFFMTRDFRVRVYFSCF